RARSPARWPADRRRGPRPGAGLPPRGLRSRLCGTRRRSVDIRAARVRTRPPPAWRPTRPGARYDSRCTRSARRASPRAPAAGRVSAPAQLDFARRLARRRPLRVARLRADRPRDGLALVERDGESLRPAVETSPVAFLLRPRDVARAGPMARLARDVDLGIGG